MENSFVFSWPPPSFVSLFVLYLHGIRTKLPVNINWSMGISSAQFDFVPLFHRTYGKRVCGGAIHRNS